MTADDFQARITEELLKAIRDVRDQNQIMFDYILKSGVSHPSLYFVATSTWEKTIDVLDRLEYGDEPREITKGVWSKYGNRNIDETFFD